RGSPGRQRRRRGRTPGLAPRRDRPGRIVQARAAASAVPGIDGGEDAARAARPDDRRPAHARRRRSTQMSGTDRATAPAAGVTTGISQKGLSAGTLMFFGAVVLGVSTVAPAYTFTAAVGPIAS